MKRSTGEFSFFLLVLETSSSHAEEPRMCSVSLRPGIDTIGISLQPDKDFGHIIKQVDSNSPASRAGIERDDCIISLNGTTLLNIPYDDVLTTLKRSRNEPNLDFLVAKKGYLLRTPLKEILPRDVTAIPTAQVMPSSNMNTKDVSSSQNPNKTLEDLYNKYTSEPKASADDLSSLRRSKETVSTTTNIPNNDRYDQVQPRTDPHAYVPQQTQQQGQIVQGVGPATADRTSWSSNSDRAPETVPVPISGDGSVRGRRTGA